MEASIQQSQQNMMLVYSQIFQSTNLHLDSNLLLAKDSIILLWASSPQQFPIKL